MKLSIIIPCYNEAKSIKENVIERVIPYLKKINLNYELILVNDGSKDNTANVINSIPDILSLSYEKNRGKGGAIKYGIEHASGDYVLFMDADLSTDLSAIDELIPLIGKYDLIIGSRHLKNSKMPVKQPLIRRFIGKMCRILVNMNFGFHLKDTQCGFKAIELEKAKFIASKQVVEGFAFDVEYLYIAVLNKWTIKEIPVIWRNDRSSTVSIFKASSRFMKDMRLVKKNKKSYILKEQTNEK
ncbi:MAG: glycosyltransferase family 2 protein [Erysipelotrichaceae bacterium]|jgi:glycosyltransferase involved in cell wall biosynthesis|nr:glycosyltransferase family 2 protein [Erysipelotrichaceae bacterium]